MRSPFPGMDPYIEARGLWGDFHQGLISAIKAVLARAAPRRYLVRTGERSYLVLIEEEGKKDYPFVADVKITSPERRGKTTKKKGDAALAEAEPTTEPLTMRALVQEEHREAFVEIYDTEPEQRLVTTIEVLSPSNKRSRTEGWDVYHRKRQCLLLGDVNLVEIDLLRGGQRMPMIDPWPKSPYTVLVARAKKPHACKVWPAYYQQPLPNIPVPLTKPDPDLSLNLQPMIDEIYELSRYSQSIDYAQPLTPPLAAKEVTWLQEQLRRVREGT